MRCWERTTLSCIGMALLLWANIAFGAVINCSGQVLTTAGNYVLPHANITVPDIPGYVLLYTATHSTLGVGVVNADCDDAREFRFALTDIPATSPVGSASGYTIYPTSIKGIGVSVNLDEYGTSELVPWPASVVGVTREASESGAVDAIVTIRIWKMPDYVPFPGSLKFSGPKIVEFITPRNNGASDTIGSCPAGAPRLQGDNRTCLLLGRTLTGDVTLRSGTCELVNANQVVTMGEHPASSNAASAWRNASFRLKCPNAYGYGSSVTDATSRYDVSGPAAQFTKNTIRNNTLKLMIVPRTPAINAVQGIFELAPGGATGYALQLAWGAYTTQTEPPTKPVELNVWHYINQVSDDFAVGPYYPGTNALKTGKDGTVQMAARYVPVSGTATPGAANAIVEVIVNYE